MFEIHQTTPLDAGLPPPMPVDAAVESGDLGLDAEAAGDVDAAE